MPGNTCKHICAVLAPFSILKMTTFYTGFLTKKTLDPRISCTLKKKFLYKKAPLLVPDL